MGELADIAASGRAIEIRGKNYLLLPLTFADFGHLESWVEGLPLEIAKLHMKGLEPAERQQLLQAAWDDSKPGTIGLSSPELTTMLQSARGAIQLLWLSLRKTEKDITTEQVGSLITPSNLHEITNTIMIISGMIDEEPSPPGSEDDENP